jgi:hypothetical protein
VYKKILVTVAAATLAFAPQALAAGKPTLTIKAGAVTGVHPGDSLSLSGLLLDDAGAALAAKAVTLNLCQAQYTGPATCVTAQATTGADGSYLGQLVVPDAAGVLPFKATALYNVGADGLPQAGASQDIDVTVTSALADLTFTSPTAASGHRVLVAGKLTTVGGTGVAGPKAGETVELYTSPNQQTWTKAGEQLTTADGTFALGFEPTVRQTFVQARIPESCHELVCKQLYTVSESKVGTVALDLHEVRFSASSVPGTVQVNTKATVAATVVIGDDAGGWKADANATVILQKGPAGGAWADYGTAKTDKYGSVTFKPAFAGDAYWRFLLPGDATSLRGEKVFFVNTTTTPIPDPTPAPVQKVHTKVALNAGPEPVKKGRRITVAGKVTQQVGKSWAKVTGRSVAVYFRAKGSSTWTLAGWAKLDKNGHYVITVKAKKDGFWRGVLKGDAKRYGATSPSDYVDVR